jgi:DNA-nicking Smr family endonuclease
MDSANAAAAAAVLDPQAWRTSPKIDLHGLYVAEAEAATRAFLDAHRPSAEGHHHMHGAAAASSLELEIVTGAGHHSKASADVPHIHGSGPRNR